MSQETPRRTFSTLFRRVVLLLLAAMFIAAQSQALLAKSSVAIVLADGSVDRFLTPDTPDHINAPRSYLDLRSRDHGLPWPDHVPSGDGVSVHQAVPTAPDRIETARRWHAAPAVSPAVSPLPPARAPPAGHRHTSATGFDHGSDA